MRHRVKKSGLNIPNNKKDLFIGNLATSLILHEKIQTTTTRAKALQSVMEKLINTASGSSERDAIRSVSAILQGDLSSKKLMQELVKRYKDKKSGYTRITKIGFRAGDAAPIVQIELI
jgi:large subunit ribosomal protein L17